MRHAVVFSSYAPSTDVSSKVCSYYIHLLRKHFADSKIYFGINTGSSSAWSEMLLGSGLDVTVYHVESHLSVNSDASGFQCVLSQLRHIEQEYDYYWFGHTKGASHQSYEEGIGLRDMIERDFWSRRQEIEQRCDPHQYGTFPAHPMPSSSENADVVSFLDQVYPSAARPIGYVTTFTFFGMTRAGLLPFLRKAKSNFFEANLVAGTGLSRYFFEGGFAWVADMAGLEPYLLTKAPSRVPASRFTLCDHSDFSANQERVRLMINDWTNNKSNYRFTGWPLKIGDLIEYQGRMISVNEFARDHPEYTITNQST